MQKKFCFGKKNGPFVLDIEKTALSGLFFVSFYDGKFTISKIANSDLKKQVKRNTRFNYLHVYLCVYTPTSVLSFFPVANPTIFKNTTTTPAL
jgi:hypothetical protein